jgi:hypothetical protein
VPTDCWLLLATGRKQLSTCEYVSLSCLAVAEVGCGGEEYMEKEKEERKVQEEDEVGRKRRRREEVRRRRRRA